MKKTVVIDIVGLSTNLIGGYTPFISEFRRQHSMQFIRPMLPAVTTAVQSSYITGKWPSSHGIVGNGWYDRTDSEIKFWKQSNNLVEGEKIWDHAKKLDPAFTCSYMFWWYNMYATVDYSLTPRPNYLADGRKMPDCYSHPASLRDELQEKFGKFPLFQFWGPGADIKSTKWIANASVYTDHKYDPTLTFIYLPHLDYCLQKSGPDLRKIENDLRQIDDVVKFLVEYYQTKDTSIILLSEYGIVPVSNPIHINRLLREANLLAIREERGLELLDAGASKAFAVADHQIAHIYINDKSCRGKLLEVLSQAPGIEHIISKESQKTFHIDHERSGDFVLVADNDSWFTYYFWLDDEKAPDYARVVDIHKKPGYDPVEMFMTSKFRAAYKLLRKKAGLRYVMDVIPLNANLIKGSHGNTSAAKEFYPVIIGENLSDQESIAATDVYDIIWKTLNSS